MSQPRTPTVVTTPTVSFSTFAKLMGACTPVKQASLLRGHKYLDDGPKRSYQNARAQMIEHLVNQQPIQPGILRDHERDAMEAIAQFGVPVPPGTVASRPTTRAPHWSFHGVDISVFPDVDLASGTGAGALKVHFNKDPLPRGVGSAMAALLHHYKTQVLNQTNVAPRHCLVYEARTGALHACGNTTRLLSVAQTTCQLIVALWPSL